VILSFLSSIVFATGGFYENVLTVFQQFPNINIPEGKFSVSSSFRDVSIVHLVYPEQQIRNTSSPFEFSKENSLHVGSSIPCNTVCSRCYPRLFIRDENSFGVVCLGGMGTAMESRANWAARLGFSSELKRCMRWVMR
jgi:hypothetical protein